MEPRWLKYGPDDPQKIMCDQCHEYLYAKYVQEVDGRNICDWCYVDLGLADEDENDED